MRPQLGGTQAIFADSTGREFLPANEAYRDEARKALDHAALRDLVGLPESVLASFDVLHRR